MNLLDADESNIEPRTAVHIGAEQVVGDQERRQPRELVEVARSAGPRPAVGGMVHLQSSRLRLSNHVLISSRPLLLASRVGNRSAQRAGIEGPQAAPSSPITGAVTFSGITTACREH